MWTNIKKKLRKEWLRIRIREIRVRRWWWRQDRRYGFWWRVGNGAAAVLMLLAVAIPVLQQIGLANSYALSSATLKLVGNTDQTLAKQLTYDVQTQTYQFNKDAIKPADTGNPLARLQDQTGTASGQGKDKSLYALDVPQNFSKGVTYHDINSSLSFSLVPEFKASDGKDVQGHLVYPLAGSTQAIYTLKNNGLKEDLVVQKATTDTMTFSYRLDLPKTLEARALPDGSGGIGIYSANPSLFGDITYGSDTDRAAVEKARERSPKTYLVFGLPAPVIKDAAGNQAGSARFQLEGDQLSVIADELSGIRAPFTIDPSVVITSASDFQSGGNNESNINFDASGQVNRGGLTGGTISGGWSSSTSFTNGRGYMASAAYNGYLYVLGGSANVSTDYNDVQYAPINAVGTVGAWHYTHNSTDDGTTFVAGFTTPRSDFAAVVYDGYMYIMGGYTGSAYLNDVQYAPLNSNGTVGTWQATTSVPVTIADYGATVYNGYLYLMGNQSASATVYYAPLQADGTVGAWQTTASLNTGVIKPAAAAYNGYVYALGGATIGGQGLTPSAVVQYARINSDGTLSTWRTTSSLPSASNALAAVAYGGYLYALAGSAGSLTQYAQINANGTIGTWQTTANSANTRLWFGAAAYNGYLYIFGGYSGSTNYTDTQYAKIDPAGTTTAWQATTSYPAAQTNKGNTPNVPGQTTNAETVAYKGYIYVIGGYTNEDNAYSRYTQYAPLNSDGTIGTWASTASLSTAAGSAGVGIYNGRIYVMGGYGSAGTPITNVQFTSFNSDGSLGAWATSTALPSAVGNHAGIAYNGYLYQIGSSGGGNSSTINYAPISATNGTVGTWQITSSLNTGRVYEQLVVNGGYMYAVGGGTTAVEYAPINSNGSLGAWTPTTSMNTALTRFGTFVRNGYIYALGGEDGGGVAQSTIEYAPINANGTVGTWVNNTAFPATIENSAIVTYGGYAYSVSGLVNGTRSLNTYYAKILNGGSGTVGTWTTSSNLLSVKNFAFGTVAYNGYLYVIGGADQVSAYYNTVYYAKINSDGTLGAFNTPGAGATFTNGREYLGVAAYNGYLYLAGGYNGTTSYTDVQFAHVLSDGTLGAWGSPGAGSTFTTTGVRGLSMEAYNGYLYELGGNDGSARHNDVRYAQINSDGTLSSWTATTSFNTPRYLQKTVVYNGYLYILGGYDTSNYYNDVQYAKLNSNGTVGTWNYTSSFAIARYSATVAAANGYMYIYGGYSGSENSDVQVAPINADGSVGTWTHTTSFTTGRDGQGGTIYSGTIYVIGGSTGSSSTTDIQYAPLDVISRIGQYSKLIDLGSVVRLGSISYHGTLPGGLAAIYYRAAGSDGVFGSTLAASSLAGGTGVCGGSGGTARYIWISASLDDSSAGVFPDSSGSNANLQDITLTYGGHPPPNIRLRAGQTLQQGTLSPLDTCYP